MALAPLVPVILALLGIAWAWWNKTAGDARQVRLAFVNEQLRSLYGPLYALSQASEAAWEKFRAQCRPDGAFFSPDHPPSQVELEAWMRWMRVVFTPMNEAMVAAIVGYADLVEGETPPVFLALIAHVEGYKVVLDKWDRGDFSEYNSSMNFPSEFNSVVRDTFVALKARQKSLMV